MADSGDVNMSLRDRLQVRVNDELVLDAGTCEEVSGPARRRRRSRSGSTSTAEIRADGPTRS